jgi:antitoxin ParD1/3/4
MASIEKIGVALPPEMVSLVRKAVATGEHASSSEMIREALRDWTRKRTLRQLGIEDLRHAWQQLIEDHGPGPGAKKSSTVWSASTNQLRTPPAYARNARTVLALGWKAISKPSPTILPRTIPGVP